MSHAYRSAYENIVGMRLAELKHAREMVEPFWPQLRSVRAARIARAVSGATGIAGALLMIFFACATKDGSATYALVGASVAMVVTYVLTRALLRAFGRTKPARAPRLTGELDRDIAELEAHHPSRLAHEGLDGLELWSTALPLAAVSLLAPLTLHYIFISVFGSESPRAFSEWIRISLVVVGHVHLTLMALAVAFAQKMRRTSDDMMAMMPIHLEWVKVWGITVLVSCLPGVVLLLVPPVLTAITGLAFIPLMFALTRRRVLLERATLALVDNAASVRIASGEARIFAPAEAWSELLPEAVPERAARM